MLARSLALVVTALFAVALTATPAAASIAGEVAAGQALAQRVQSGAASCSTLSDADFDHLGEFVMQRMAGSAAAHAAMDARMASVLGAATADRMHVQMGRRYAGCATAAASVPMGPAMMGAGGYAWMRDGAWRHMSQGQWRTVAATMTGPRASMHGVHGWTTTGVLAALAAGLAAGGLLVFAATRRRPRAPATPA